MTDSAANSESAAYGVAAFTLVTALLGRLEERGLLDPGDKSALARIAASMAASSAERASDPLAHGLAQHILAHLADAWDESAA